MNQPSSQWALAKDPRLSATEGFTRAIWQEALITTVAP